MVPICGYGSKKTGMDRSAGDPDVWIGLDHLRFGMDHGVWIACGTGVWIGTLHFEPQPYLYYMRPQVSTIGVHNYEYLHTGSQAYTIQYFRN